MIDTLRSDALKRMSNSPSAFNLACNSTRSSNLIETSGDTPIALTLPKNHSAACFLNKLEYMDVGFNRWCNMLDWKPEYNSFANVLDDLAKFDSVPITNKSF